MTIRLNHTIVNAHDKRASAEFLAGILGLEVGAPVGPFLPVHLDNDVALDFMDHHADPPAQHYAFKLDPEAWEAAQARLLDRGIQTWADPHKQEPDGVYDVNGEKGAYFDDPSGHLMEILTDS